MNAKELIGKTIADAALWRMPNGVTGDVYMMLKFTDGEFVHIEANSFEDRDFIKIYPGGPIGAIERVG